MQHAPNCAIGSIDLIQSQIISTTIPSSMYPYLSFFPLNLFYIKFWEPEGHYHNFRVLHYQWLFSHESKVRNLSDHSNYASFEWRYFGPCVRKFASRCVSWIAQFKWQSGGVFQWRISRITQRNRRMNALTCKLWFGGGATWPSNHFRLHIMRCICTEAQEMQALCMFDWQGTQTTIHASSSSALEC